MIILLEHDNNYVLTPCSLDTTVSSACCSSLDNSLFTKIRKKNKGESQVQQALCEA